MSKILKLFSENIKRLHAVEIEPDGRVVQLTGKNGAGKSSIIDSIWYAAGGKDALPGEPIRRGEDSAKIELTLSGDPPLKIIRTFTEGKKSSLKVEQGEGFKASSPQTLVNGLFDRLSFDPLLFTRGKQEKQLETLRKLSGIDTREVELEVDQLFDARGQANKAVKQQKALAEDAGSRLAKDCPTGVVSLSAIVNRLELGRDVNAQNAAERKVLEEMHEDASETETELTRLDAQVKELIEERNRKASLLAEAKEAIAKAERHVEQLKDVDLSPIQEELGVAESRNDQARAHEAWQAMETEATNLERAADELTGKLETARKKKADMTAAGNMPIPGLSFGTGEILYNEHPFEQASQAEQISVSMAIAAAMNPEVGVVCIREGSLLDSASMKIVIELAEKYDLQVWLEQVDETGEVGVYIEDGMVQKIEGKPVAQIPSKSKAPHRADDSPELETATGDDDDDDIPWAKNDA